MSSALWCRRASTGNQELTPGQQKPQKRNCARGKKNGRKERLTPTDLRVIPVQRRKADTLPVPGHRTLRADVEKLDHMLDLTGEIVIAQGRLRRLIQKLGTEQGRAMLEMHREAERLYMDLQSEVMSIRMVPVGPLFRQLVRSVRDLARSHGKMARLEVVGGDVESGYDRARAIEGSAAAPGA